MWNEAKAILREKFTALTYICLKKDKRLKINDLWLHLKNLKKQTIKPKEVGKNNKSHEQKLKLKKIQQSI